MTGLFSYKNAIPYILWIGGLILGLFFIPAFQVEQLAISIFCLYAGIFVMVGTK